MNNKKVLAIFKGLVKDFADEQWEQAKAAEREAKRRRKVAKAFTDLMPIMEEMLNPKPIKFPKARRGKSPMVMVAQG